MAQEDAVKQAQRAAEAQAALEAAEEAARQLGVQRVMQMNRLAEEKGREEREKEALVSAVVLCKPAFLTTSELETTGVFFG
jgi:hypothetical protein